MAISEDSPVLRIGELSRRAGVSGHVLRAWERRYGLLQPVGSEGGFRLYTEADERRVRRMRKHLARGLSAAQAARATLQDDAAPGREGPPGLAPRTRAGWPGRCGRRLTPSTSRPCRRSWTGSCPIAASYDSASWRQSAACRSYDSGLFFPIGKTGRAVTEIQRAKAVCAACPVQTECLAFALETHQAYGIWGGCDEDERRTLRRQQQRRLS